MLSAIFIVKYVSKSKLSGGSGSGDTFFLASRKEMTKSKQKTWNERNGAKNLKVSVNGGDR